ncbi:carbamate kinase [Fistulifera solaris]|uniref:Carbamate kinase n=1 Tax=Fistulifera solaris TaxID=1519565 RepID=A0A1Z5J8Y4_FISSO|nr:carbamate kinase [Fistulifera solaris]|eukprot:GAX10450.1 carbamate kinase [Fistulifera solaris]
MTISNQRHNIRDGMQSLADIVRKHKTTIVHGNGPQVGLLMLESDAYERQTGLQQISLDVLDAETEGMIGYMIEQELQPYLSQDQGMVTVLSQIVVSPDDPSMLNPTKFVGPVYTKEEANKLSVPVKADGKYFRRVVPSPQPIKLVPHQLQVVQKLTDAGCIVICGGGGGIPVVEKEGRYEGIEAVIDKDRAATMIGKAIGAQGLLILTDIPAVAIHYGTEQQKFIKTISPNQLETLKDHFPAGSMGPKVESAIDFVRLTNGWAAIGSLQNADEIVAGKAGTMVRDTPTDDPVVFYEKGDI